MSLDRKPLEKARSLAGKARFSSHAHALREAQNGPEMDKVTQPAFSPIVTIQKDGRGFLVTRQSEHSPSHQRSDDPRTQMRFRNQARSGGKYDHKEPR
jgi:hypothetical protein